MDNLHTGWTAVDALTPIGRGQSMLVAGNLGSGKTTLAAETIATQLRRSSSPLCI